MVSTNDDNSASPRPGHTTRQRGHKCPRCKRFGTFAPNSIVCDNCQGALPLAFVVAVTVVVGGER